MAGPHSCSAELSQTNGVLCLLTCRQGVRNLDPTEENVISPFKIKKKDHWSQRESLWDSQSFQIVLSSALNANRTIPQQSCQRTDGLTMAALHAGAVRDGRGHGQNVTVIVGLYGERDGTPTDGCLNKSPLTRSGSNLAPALFVLRPD
ncbi:hypothetical protein J6590_049593 [Homalodisca vitripennis]|nr:hypothetical protein J6590_049593 [Homalodisca vitripennis]